MIGSIGDDGVEVEVDHLGALDRVALHLADQRLDRRATVDGDVDQGGLAADDVEQLAEGARLDRRARGSSMPCP